MCTLAASGRQRGVAARSHKRKAKRSPANEVAKPRAEFLLAAAAVGAAFLRRLK